MHSNPRSIPASVAVLARVWLAPALLFFLLSRAATAQAADHTSTWNNTSGDWTETSRWNTPTAPGTFPNNGTSTYDAILNGGALTVNQAITVEKFTMTGGTHSGSSTLTANDVLTLGGGNLQGSGVINALGGGVLVGMEMSGRTINLGDGSGPVFNTTWSSGDPLVHGGLVINNKSDSNFIVGFDGGSFRNINRSGSMVFNNEGTFTKNGGSGIATIGTVNNGSSSFAFNNSGLVQVNSGTLRIISPTGTHTGAFQTASGATLDIASAQILSTGTTFTGAGRVLFSGIITASAATTVDSNLNFSGTLNGSGAVTANGDLIFTGKMESGASLTAIGAVTLFGGVEVNSGSVLNLGDGAGPDAVSSTTWLTGSILMRSPSTINNRSDSVINATANNQLFTNTSGTGFTFNNEGTFNQNGTGTTTIGITLNNSGLVQVNSGTLLITGSSSTNTGDFVIASGATLNLGGTMNLNAGSTFTGAGTTVFGGLPVNVNVATTVDCNLNITAGTVTGSGPLTVNGDLTFTAQMAGGVNVTATGDVTLNGGGREINEGSVLNLGDGAGPDAGSTTTWSSGGILMRSPSTLNNRSDSVINATANEQLFTKTSGLGFNFNNEGTFNQNGTGTTTIGIPFNSSGTVNVNSGTLLITNSYTQTAGALVLNGGSVSRSGGNFTITGGKIQGGGTITGGVSATGGMVIIEPGIGSTTGTLAITGNLTLTSGSKLSFDIGGTTPGTGHDQITEAGSSAFARSGLLLIALFQGFENSIQAANTFNLVSSNQATTGQFANVIAGRVYTIDGRGSFAINSGSNAVTATDFAPSTEAARLLKLNQQMVGYLETPSNRWSFTGSAGQQVRLRPVNATAPGVAYTLVGPGGFKGFTYLSEQSGLVSLPQTGTYTLGVVSLNSQPGGSYSFVLEETAQTTLAIDGTFVGTLEGNNQAQLFRITVTEPGALTIALENAGLGNNVRLYLSRNVSPNLTDFEYQDSAGPGASRSLTVPQATSGEWYLLVYADEVLTPGSFNLDVGLATVALTSLAPSSQATNQPAVLTLYGAGFTPGTTAELVPASGSPIAAASVQINSLTQLTATFAANSAAPGTYGIRVRKTNGDTATLPAAFNALLAGEGKLETKLIMPRFLGRHVTATIIVEYANVGTAAIPAPLIGLVSADPSTGELVPVGFQEYAFDHAEKPILTLDSSRVVENFWSGTKGLPPGTSSEILFLGSGAQPGVLAPGERVTVPVYYLGLLQPWNNQDEFVELKLLTWTTSDSDSMDWSDRWGSMRPPTYSRAAWNALYPLVTTGIETTGAFIQMLSDNARFLQAQGRDVRDVRELWAFEVLQATGVLPKSTLSAAQDVSATAPGISLAVTRRYPNGVHARRYEGPFGRGWFCYWFTSLAVKDADDSVAGADVVRITGSEGEARTFTQDKRNGSYYPGPGDAATLTFQGGGVYELKETNGMVTRFTADGRINYTEDPNGNRVTASYDGTQRLIGLTHTSGAIITLAYNSSGQISQVTTSEGRSATYSYTGTNLTSVTTDDGKVTSYTYLPPVSANTMNALASITQGGTTRHFTWDAAGRLASTSLGAGEETVTFGHDNAGGTTITQGTNVRSLFFDHRGQLAKTMDALGEITEVQYDSDGNLERLTLPTGDRRQFSWFPNLKPKSITDELGRTTRMEYNHPLNRMTRFIDAKGATTNYSYDANGNPLTTTYADGSIEQWSGYNAIGFPASRANRRGQNLGLTFTSNGLLDRRTFSDGSYVDFDYDARGNPVTMTEHPAIGADKVTTFTYTPATDGDRLRRVTYPDARFVEYFYNTDGRRSRMTDSAGGDTRYEYDGASRLWKLRDAASNVLAEYLYDSAGRLARVNKGNGTATTHTYDAVGRLILLANLDAEESVHTSFAYTYDERGLRRSATTQDGTWTYTYDATRQLVRATLASTNPSIANQDLRYFYDQVGNRVSTLINGVATDYVSNNLNQYLGIGGIPQSYDADGNLISDGLNTYTYNTLNQLAQVSGLGGVTQHEYDALGNRTATIVNGQRTEYLLDLTGIVHVLAEFDATGLAARNLHGLGLVNRVAGGNTGWFDFDATGSVTAVRQNSGALLNRYAFEPFGASLLRTETMSNPFQFAGQFGVQTDADGGIFMRARHYRSGTGHFMQDDPIRLAGGDVNLRRYVGNDPISFLDPVGTYKQGDAQNGALGQLANKIKDWFGDNRADLGVDVTTDGLGAALAHRNDFIGNSSDAGDDSIADQAEHIGDRVNDGVHDTLDDLEDLGMAITPKIGPKGPKKPGFGVFGKFFGVVFNLLDGGGLLKPPGGDENGEEGNSGVAEAIDPNEKLGPAGFGPENWLAPDKALPYRVNFENIGPGSVDGAGNPFPTFATAPAQRVTITDELQADFDWATFQWTGFGFGDVMLTPSTAASHYTGTDSMTYNGQTFDVKIDAAINFNTGLVTVSFQSLVPGTGLPPDVLTGFLPPEDGTGRGKGFITYTVRAKPNLPTGTAIRNVASIRFDSNSIITTDQIDPQNAAAGTAPDKQALITIDQTPPTSAVTALSTATVGTGISLNWSGSDVGSGIANYDIYVSENSGPWTLWLEKIAQTSARYSGQAGRSYSFFSVARDHAGLVETPSFAPDATTTPQAFTLMTITTTQATPVSVSEAKVLLRASSHLGMPMAISNVITPSTSGGVVVRNAGMITYLPAPTFTGTDTYSVTVSDGTNLIDGTMTVIVTAVPGGLNPKNTPSVVTLPGGAVTVSFAGIPGRSYHLQRSTDLMSWTTLSTVTASSVGSVIFNDPSPPQPNCFYRISY